MLPSWRSFGVYKLDINQGNYVTQDMVDKLKVGMTTSQVQGVLGTAPAGPPAAPSPEPQHAAPPLPAPLQPYVTGFVLALVLTGIPFGLVAAELLPRFTALVVIAVLAVVQVVVHLRYFLHIDLESTPRDNLLALAFAAVLIFLMIGGTLWIMLDLDARMMG